jgi:hypothetical protein
MREQQVHAWDLETGKIAPRYQSVGKDSGFALSPDGGRALCREADALYLWETETGRIVRRLEVGPAEAAGLAFSSDGRSP